MAQGTQRTCGQIKNFCAVIQYQTTVPMVPFTFVFLSLLCVSVYCVHHSHEIGSRASHRQETLGIDTWTQTGAPVLGIGMNWAKIASDATGKTILGGVASGGLVYISTDYGATFNLSPTTLSPTEPITGLCSDYAGKHFIVAQKGFLFYSHNAGVNWTKSNSPYLAWNSVSSDSSGAHLVASALPDDVLSPRVSAIYTSSDYGVNWLDTGASSGLTWVSVGSDASGRNLFAVAAGVGIYTSTNYGQLWLPTSAPQQYYGAVTCDSTGQYLVAVASAGIYTSNSSGLMWYKTSAPIATNGGYTAVDSDSTGKYIYASSYSANLVSSSDFGVTWVNSFVVADQTWAGITVSQSGLRVSAMSTTTIWSYQDNSTHAPSALPTTRPTAMPSANDPDRTAAPTTTAQLPWTKSNVTAHAWKSLSSDTTGQYLVAAEQTTDSLWTSSDFGTNWVQRFTLANAVWSRVVSSSDGTNLAASINGGRIYISADRGHTWVVSLAPKEAYSGLACDYSGKYMVSVVGNGGIHTSTNYGMNWTLNDAAPTAQWTDVTSDQTGQYLAAGAQSNRIYTSTDYGVSWSASDSPIVTWYAIASDASGRYLVACQVSGGIYTSTDYGKTWVKTSAPATAWYSVSSDNTGAYLAAVVNGGGVYLSSDFGSTWEKSAAPTDNWTTITTDSGGKRLAAAGTNPVGIWTFYDPTTFKPSSSPTVAPSRPTAKPTFVPSWSPTTSPSFSPTLKPNATPTRLPSRGPTAPPTANPTTGPGEPSTNPTFEPTFVPTAEPTTDAPTVGPTLTPTTASPTSWAPAASPSWSPSAVPSCVPSGKPTAIPTTRSPTTTLTAVPSAMPTSPVAFALVFDSNITIAQSTSPVLDAASQSAVVTAAAKSMGVDSSAVTYVGAVVVGTIPGRRLSQRGWLASFTKAADVSTEAVMYTLQATTRTKVSITGTGLTDPTSLYTSLTNELATNVANGDFTDFMRAADSGDQLSSASANTVASSEPVVETSPLPASNGGSDGGSSTVGMIAGLVVGLVLGSMIVACIFYWRCLRHTGGVPPGQRKSHSLNVSEGNLLAPDKQKKKSFRNALFKSKKSSKSGKSEIKSSSKHGSKHGFSALDDDNDTFEYELNPAISTSMKNKAPRPGFDTYQVWDLEAGEGEGSPGKKQQEDYDGTL